MLCDHIKYFMWLAINGCLTDPILVDKSINSVASINCAIPAMFVR